MRENTDSCCICLEYHLPATSNNSGSKWIGCGVHAYHLLCYCCWEFQGTEKSPRMNCLPTKSAYSCLVCAKEFDEKNIATIDQFQENLPCLWQMTIKTGNLELFSLLSTYCKLVLTKHCFIDLAVKALNNNNIESLSILWSILSDMIKQGHYEEHDKIRAELFTIVLKDYPEQISNWIFGEFREAKYRKLAPISAVISRCIVNNLFWHASILCAENLDKLSDDFILKAHFLIFQKDLHARSHLGHFTRRIDDALHKERPNLYCRVMRHIKISSLIKENLTCCIHYLLTTWPKCSHCRSHHLKAAYDYALANNNYDMVKYILWQGGKHAFLKKGSGMSISSVLKDVKSAKNPQELNRVVILSDFFFEPLWKIAHKLYSRYNK